MTCHNECSDDISVHRIILYCVDIFACASCLICYRILYADAFAARVSRQAGLDLLRMRMRYTYNYSNVDMAFCVLRARYVTFSGVK